MRNNFSFLLLLFLWTALPCLSQHPFYKNYQAKDGLRSNYTYFVFQDSKGYIWTCSDVGVSRFDGHEFTHFDTASGMSDNEVFSMMEDRKGRLWFATLNGKPCLYQNGLMHNENNTPLLKQGALRGMALHLFEQANGDILMGSPYKLISINLERNTCKTLTFQTGLRDLCTGADGRTIGVSGIEVFELGPDSMTLVANARQHANPLNCIRIGDTLLVASQEYMVYVDFKSKKVQKDIQIVPTGNEIIYLRQQKEVIWVGTRKGFFVFEYPSLRLLKTFLPGQSVSSALEDQEGGLWFSTLGGGLFYIPTPDILHFTSSDGLLYDRIACLARDSQSLLWIGMEGSTYSIFDGKKIENRQVQKQSARNKTIFNIRHFPNGKTLIIGKPGTLIIEKGKQSLLYQRASDANIDASGNYWTGLTGLCKIPKEDIPLKTASPKFLNTPKELDLYRLKAPRQRTDLRIEKVEFDFQQRIWLAASTGLYEYVESEDRVIQLLPYTTKDILQDPLRGILWVLTEYNGLFALRDGRIVDSLAITNNQGSVICRDLCRDAEGHLWIGSSGGLFQVSGQPGALKLSSYWGIFGLGTEKINAVEAIREYIYLGKDDGFLQIPKSMLTQQTIAPKVQISNIRLRNETLGEAGANTLSLEYGKSPLSIEFIGISYREGQNISYAYRMSGMEEQWHSTTNTAVEYAALRPGNYVFEVYATNSTGIQSHDPARLSLRVLPPFWLKPWFFLVLIALLFGGIGGYIRNREAKIRRKFEIERQLIESSQQNTELQKKNTDLRMLALRLQMNPHFIFNALNTIKGYYGQDKIVEANAFISKFARLLRLNLDYSDALIPLQQEVELLKIYIHLSQTRYPDKIHFQLSVSPELHTEELLIPSMVLQPFVENAVIHGVVPKKGEGNIRLSFQKSGEKIKVLIQDDGVGRGASANSKIRDLHKPLATQITIERLQLLLPDMQESPIQFRDLLDENGEAAGTEVILYMPFQHRQQHDQRHHY